MNPRSVMTISPSTMLPLRGLCRISLLVVILLASCAPVAAPSLGESESLPQPAAPQTEPPVEPSPLPTATLPPEVVTEAPSTEAPTAVPLPVATSRGPNLEATDPATVSLASGDLQLVEFFRFT